jgi:hypothetical protein
MLFKHKHELEELRAKGRRATGEIRSMKTLGSGGSASALLSPDEDLTTTWFECSMQLRVVPDDRTDAPFEAEVLTRIHTIKAQGATVPVWYDPHDHSRVVVDYEADVQAEMHAVLDGDRLLHRHDQVVGRAWTPVAGTLLPLEVLATRGQGRLVPKGRLGQLVAASAAQAMAYVYTAAHELAPRVDPGWFATHDIQIDEAYGDVSRYASQADGLDAGLAVAAAFVSLLTGRIVRPEIAVTGRLDAAGELLPVMDYPGKMIASVAGHAHSLIAPAGHRPEQWKVPQHDRRGLELIFSATAKDALQAALAPHPISGYAPPA